MAPKCPAPKRHGVQLSGAQSAVLNWRRPNGGTQMDLPRKTLPSAPTFSIAYIPRLVKIKVENQLYFFSKSSDTSLGTK